MRLVHRGAPWGRRVLPGLLGSSGYALGLTGPSGVAWFIEVNPLGHRIHQSVLWGLPGTFGVAGLIMVQQASLGSSGCALGGGVFMWGHLHAD